MISGYIESSPFSAAVADDNTAVYEVFRAHFDQLVQAMRNSPTALIPVLYSKRLISDTDKTRPALDHSLGVGNFDIGHQVTECSGDYNEGCTQSSTSGERVV